MNILFSQMLNSRQSAELLELIRLCEADEPTHLMFSLSESDSFYFLGYEDGLLISALALYRAGQFYECTAATSPSERKKGRFSALLSEAEDHFPDTDFLFLTDGCSPSAALVLSHLGCELEHSDCLMEQDLSAIPSKNLPLSSLPSGYTLEKADSEDGAGVCYTVRCSSVPAGECSVFSTGGSACIWGVFVEEAFRRKGLGTALVVSVLNDLSSKTYKTVLLHVDGDNLPAISLYKKSGFQITRTILYYLY